MYLCTSELVPRGCKCTFLHGAGAFAIVMGGVFKIDDERLTILVDQDIALGKVIMLNTVCMDVYKALCDVQPTHGINTESRII